MMDAIVQRDASFMCGLLCCLGMRACEAEAVQAAAISWRVEGLALTHSEC